MYIADYPVFADRSTLRTNPLFSSLFTPPFLDTTKSSSRTTINSQGDLGWLYNALSASEPTSTQTSTQTQKQNPSPALEAMGKSFIDRLNELSRGYQQAYQGKQDSYQDVINALTNTYRTRESGAMGAAATGALSSGLTPLEASGASKTAGLDVLAQYFPQLAGLRTEQADVGVQLQKAYEGLQQNLNLPFMQNVMSPYYQGVAGQTTTGQQTVEDILGKQNLLARLYELTKTAEYQQQVQNLEAQKLAQQAQQFAQTFAANQDQFSKTMVMNADQFNKKLAADLFTMMTGREFQTGERMGGQEFRTGERKATQQFQAEETDKVIKAVIERLQLEGKIGGTSNDISSAATEFMNFMGWSPTKENSLLNTPRGLTEITNALRWN